MGESSLLRNGLEEIFWSAFPEGHPPLRSPQDLAEVTEEFLARAGQDPESILQDSVAINHLAFLMARPRERLDDAAVEEYCELARFALRALAMAD